jgi:hypothetical protein
MFIPVDSAAHSHSGADLLFVVILTHSVSIVAFFSSRILTRGRVHSSHALNSSSKSLYVRGYPATGVSNFLETSVEDACDVELHQKTPTGRYGPWHSAYRYSEMLIRPLCPFLLASLVTYLGHEPCCIWVRPFHQVRLLLLDLASASRDHSPAGLAELDRGSRTAGNVLVTPPPVFAF